MSKLVRVVTSGAGLRRVNVVTAGAQGQQPLWTPGAPDDRRYESVLQNSVADPSCKSVLLPGGGGGEDVPGWVPANAKIYIDLVNDRAWTEADGIVAIDTLLGSDPNTENGWGATSYDAGTLTADGYAGTSPIAFIGAARTALLSEATARIQAVVLSSGTSVVEIYVIAVSEDGNDAVEIDLGHNNRNVRALSWRGSASLLISDITNVNLEGAIDAIAITIADDRLDVAANGSSAVSIALDASDRPPGNPFVAALVHKSESSVALQSITIYDALPDTTGLSALSQTGVTNTAPHDIVVANVYDPFSLTSPNAISVSGPAIDDVVVDVLTGVSASDDEGSPLIFSITADDTGGLAVVDVGQINVKWTTSAGGPAPGDYNFTLRATDPGGLYVEQEFTITVTAG